MKHIKVTHDLHGRLKLLAAQRGQQMQYIVNLAIESYIKDQELELGEMKLSDDLQERADWIQRELLGGSNGG